MSTATQTKFSHKLFEPNLSINEAKTHCVAIFDKLKLQREQGRFCDVMLKVYDRDFPAHRCVLASCSPWFDTKFKVHKTLKETIEIENCTNYEVFHLVLTYMYSGEVVINKDNVADILAISHMYSINKLKSYCAEFLEKNIKVSNCINAMELAEKHHLVDFSKQTLAFIKKNFEGIMQFHEIEKKNVSEMQHFIAKSYGLPSQLMLRIITRWMESNPDNEDHFPNLLNNLSWSTLDPAFIEDYLDSEKLFKNNEDVLVTVLAVMERNNVELSAKYRAISQEKLLYGSELPQELADSSDFLFMKDLENSDMYESISSIMQNMQNDSIGNESSYGGGPYRHPSGNDIEVFKAEAETSGELNQGGQTKKAMKRSTSSSRDDECKSEQEELRAGTNKIHIDQQYGLLQDPRLYLGDMRGADNTQPPTPGGGVAANQLGISNLPHSTDQITSPPQTNLNHADAELKTGVSGAGNQTQELPPYSSHENCGGGENIYKNFSNTQSQQLTTSTTSSAGVMQGGGGGAPTESYYRQSQYQAGKSGQVASQFSNSELRFHSMVDQVEGELFKQHDLCVYREDLRGGGGGYPQLGFLPPPGMEQLVFSDHQVFPRDQVSTNNTRDTCGSHANYIENYKHMATSEQQNLMLPRSEEYQGSYTKDGADSMARGNNSIPSTSDPYKPDRIDRMNTNRSNVELDYQQLLDQHLLDIFHDRSASGNNMDQVINDQRLIIDRSVTTTKRYDPKFRALAEASKQVEPDHNLFGYKPGESDVVGDPLNADYKTHYSYKLSQTEGGYRGHTGNFKQHDFMMDKNDLDCYRYGEMNRDCSNYKANEDMNGYVKEMSTTDKNHSIPRSVETSGRSVNNGYLSCAAELSKENLQFDGMHQGSYPQDGQQADLKPDRSVHHMSQYSGGQGEGAVPEIAQNDKRMSGSKQTENWKDTRDLDIGEQNLQQEFKNCRISERTASDRQNSDHDTKLLVDNTSDAASMAPAQNIVGQYDMSSTSEGKQMLTEERQWTDQTRKNSWNSRHEHRNTKFHGELCQGDQQDFISPSPKLNDYQNSVKFSDDQRLQHQRKSRHIVKDNKILENVPIDCEFVEDMRPISYDPIPMTCATPHYSRDSGSIIEPFRNSEILEPSFLELQDMNSFTSEMKKSILETPPRKELDSPSRRRQKTVPPPMILTPKEKYAKEINAERKLDNVLKNVFSDTVVENVEGTKRKLCSLDKSTESINEQTSDYLMNVIERKSCDQNQSEIKPQKEDSELTFDQKIEVPPETPDSEAPPPDDPALDSPGSLVDASDGDKEEDLGSEAVHNIKIQNNIPQILKAKKKLASQKKFILEHGAVKLTHKQKVKLKQKRKKVISTEKKTAESAEQSSNDSTGDAKTKLGMKKIVNLKDKLLARHRSQSVTSLPTSMPTVTSLPETTVQPEAAPLQMVTSLSGMTSMTSMSGISSLSCETSLPGLNSLSTVNSLSEMPNVEANQLTTNTVDSLPPPQSVVGQNIIIKRPPMVAPGKDVSSLDVKTINLNDLTSGQTDLTCPFCNVVVLQRKDFFKHIKDVHLPVQPYKCPKCDQEHTKISLLLKHYKTHIPKYQCSVCDKTLLTNIELRNHVKIHKPAPSFTCQICNKSFSSKNNMEQHKAVHSDERKFKCTQCGYSTKFSSHLTEHKRTHEGKVHRCTVDGCPYWTPKRTLLNAHMRMHNGEKKFVCKVCNKGFVEAGQLRRHERIHSSEKQFVCDVEGCSYSSTRKDKLKEHKGRIHNREPTPPPQKKRPSKLSSLNKYYIPSVRSDISEVVDEDDPEAGHQEDDKRQSKKGEGVNKYYSVEGGVHLSESQIPYVKEEYILGM